MNIQCIRAADQDQEISTESGTVRTNAYEVRINGKLQGTVRARFEDDRLSCFTVGGLGQVFHNQHEAVLACIRNNGRKVDKDAKVKYKRH